MTRRYEITGVKVSFGPGTVLGLTDKQAQSRLQNLKKLSGDRYTVIGAVEFKCGEIVRLAAEIPKGLAGKIALVEEGSKAQIPASEKYSFRHKGSGRYEIVDAKGSVISDRLMTKDEANEFIRNFKAGAA